FSALDRRDDNVARRYAMDVLATVKQNGVLLAGADAIAFPVLYLQAVEAVRVDVTTVFLPVLPEAWYVRELRRAHPDLALTLDGYGPRAAPFRVFLDANRGRSTTIVGDFVDDSTKNVYWLYPRGIAFEIRPIAQSATLDELARDNEAALSASHPPTRTEVDRPFRPWERLALTDYASAYYRVGSEYENAANNLRASAPDAARQGFTAARTWYERALAIEPDFAQAQVALQRLPKT